jgi:FlaA1/EpsC-like NDP-sugar epimerase
LRLSPSIKSLIIDSTLILLGCLILPFLTRNAINNIYLLLTFEILIRSTFLFLFKCHKIQLVDITSKDIGNLIQSQLYATVCIIFGLLFLSDFFYQFSEFENGSFQVLSILELIQFAIISLILITRRTLKFNNVITRKETSSKTKAVLYGGKTLGKQLLTSFAKDDSLDFEIIALVDEDTSLKGTMILGRRIVLPNYIKTNWKKDNIQLVIFTEDAQLNKSEILDFCLKQKINVLEIPPMSQWISQEFSSNQLKPIKIEDLLGRTSISLDQNLVSENLRGKSILVTGAAGSIGSGLVEQILAFNPSQIVLLDQSETGIYDVLNHFDKSSTSTLLTGVICDVNNYGRLAYYFEKHKPSIVFHAAAYKHVPLMESNPLEAIETNIYGSLNVAKLANAYKCETFVMISTDKAVNPTNVMGATKRAAEIFTQQLSESSKTKFIITRFGNVLGSNGSVIPLFEKQIKEGGPITLTDERITRFFMTIPEACQLVLEASTIGKGSEIFVFDMGEPIRIKDLAEKMIQLSGLEVDVDIKIETIGLRPGEKLYEELLNQSELTGKTVHPKILIGKSNQPSEALMTASLNQLRILLDKNNITASIKVLKQLIPEYKSNNSEFEELD